MATSAFKEKSHLEENSPPPSVHGAAHEAHDGSDASSTDHAAEKTPPPPPLTRWQKVKRHYRRYWLYHLIGLIIFLAILLPITFKVIIPAIVQAIVKSQALPVHNASLYCLTPTEIMVTLNTSLDTPLPARIDPATLMLYNKNASEFSPYVNISLPEKKIDGLTGLEIVNQTISVNNETELIAWFHNVFDLETVKLSSRADLTVRLGALHSNPRLDKTVEVPALNKLQNFGVNDLQVMYPPDEKGNNIKGLLNLPDWSIFTLSLGNLTFNIHSGDVKIGFITAYDVLIRPGNNTASFDGQLYLPHIVDNIGPILKSQRDALARGQIELNTTGNSTVVNGQRIRYIEEVLNNKKITSSISVVTLLSDIVSGFMGGNGEQSLIDILGDIVGNNTLLDQVIDHWNTTGTTTSGTGQGQAGRRKVKKAYKRQAMAWNLMKMGMMMNKR